MLLTTYQRKETPQRIKSNLWITILTHKNKLATLELQFNSIIVEQGCLSRRSHKDEGG
ncbi:MAG: hypothetical protein AAB963_01755 [Patescibacteria group bacterium]